jgi:O-antigen/teichoic acid export membrane protein
LKFAQVKQFRREHQDLLVLFLQRGWQGLAGLITVGLAVHLLTPEELGAYYSFLSLAGISTLVDFGLSTVVLQRSARYFTYLSWDKEGTVQGEAKEELLGFMYQSVNWFRWIAITFFVFMLPVGWIFFQNIPALETVAWRLPWVCLCAFVTLSLCFTPYVSMIEGSGRISEVYKIRLLQGLIGASICWLILLSGGALYALMASSLAIGLVGFVWLWQKYPQILNISDFPKKFVSWRTSVWPFQWRIGLGLLCAYAQIQLISPILLKTQGPGIAGKMGVSLTIINMIAMIAQSSLVRKVPEFARTAVQGQRGAMDKVFFQSLGLALTLFFIGVMGFLILLNILPERWLMSKMLSNEEFIMLAFAVFFNICAGGFTMYIRSFNTEPFVLLTIISSLMIITIGYSATMQFSVLGYLTVLLLVNGLIVFPIALLGWLRYRRINFKM